MTDLFAPYTLGDLQLTNRLIMAPLTRNRAGAGEAPTELAAEYYGQRATAGLIISEGPGRSSRPRGGLFGLWGGGSRQTPGSASMKP